MWVCVCVWVFVKLHIMVCGFCCLGCFAVKFEPMFIYLLFSGGCVVCWVFATARFGLLVKASEWKWKAESERFWEKLQENSAGCHIRTVVLSLKRTTGICFQGRINNRDVTRALFEVAQEKPLENARQGHRRNTALYNIGYNTSSNYLLIVWSVQLSDPSCSANWLEYLEQTPVQKTSTTLISKLKTCLLLPFIFNFSIFFVLFQLFFKYISRSFSTSFFCGLMLMLHTLYYK